MSIPVDPQPKAPDELLRDAWCAFAELEASADYARTKLGALAAITRTVASALDDELATKIAALHDALPMDNAPDELAPDTWRAFAELEAAADQVRIAVGSLATITKGLVARIDDDLAVKTATLHNALWCLSGRPMPLEYDDE